MPSYREVFSTKYVKGTKQERIKLEQKLLEEIKDIVNDVQSRLFKFERCSQDLSNYRELSLRDITKGTS